jgi:ABC-2 type transport system ATP-binding protein
MSTDYSIEIENLNYRYKSHWLIGSKPGIKNVNIQVNAGEAFGFLGSNGAGKTTTIKLLLGLTKPDSGSCKIFGIPSHLPEARRQIGYVSEQPYFYDNLTVFELMELYATLVGINRGKRDAIMQCLEAVQIQHKAQSRMRGLSKGQVQRVAMAQAILGNPRLLILDEPLSGLDPVGRREFMNLLTQQHSQGVSIFMSSHILTDVESLCERASIMFKGEIKTIIETERTLHLTDNRFEVTLTDSIKDKDRLLSLATNQRQQNQRLILEINGRKNLNLLIQESLALGVSIERLIPLRDSLENIFIQVTTEQAQK